MDQGSLPTRPAMPLRHRVSRFSLAFAVALTALAAPASAVRAESEEPDLKIELVGLPLSKTQTDVVIRITNTSVWWANETKARVETISPTAGNVLETTVENLDPGQSTTLTYTLPGACNGQVIKAQVTAGKNYADVPESNMGNNVVQGQACPPQKQSTAQAPVPTPAPAPTVITGADGRYVVIYPSDQNAGDLLLKPKTANTGIFEAVAEGPHTIDLGVVRSLPQAAARYFPNSTYGCTPGGGTPVAHDGFIVGWEQLEIDGTPCYSGVAEVAVVFDKGPLANLSNKTIDRVVLSYDEAPAPTCVGGTALCWRSGGGSPETKPNGCAVVRIPTADWLNAAPGSLMPYLSGPRPAITRVSAREWDVTEPYRWQNASGAPLGGTPGVGFLLTGGFSRTDQLQAEDNTTCASVITNLHLHVTYTISAGGNEPFRAPR